MLRSATQRLLALPVAASRGAWPPGSAACSLPCAWQASHFISSGRSDDDAAGALEDAAALAEHASQIVGVTQQAELAAIAAARADCWWGTTTFIDTLVACEGVLGLPW
jgi:hypothetical protein